MKALDVTFTAEDEAFVNDLVVTGHAAAPGLQRSAISDRGSVSRGLAMIMQKPPAPSTNAEVARFSALAESGGTRAARWRRCTSSIRCGSPTSATPRASASGAIRSALDCLKGLRILDIGCGGGILCEPLARLGASVVGADPAEKNIAAAKVHAEQGGLAIDYRATTAEALADAGERFDIVLAMEVVEHVADVKLFVARCAEMVQPGGLMIAATINRTLKSFALAIVGAEYVLRWLPRGTHQLGQVRHAGRARDRDGARRASRDRRARRDLQSRSPTAGSSRPTPT